MATHEIDSFVQKFRKLWSAGYCAHLDLDSNAGEAWVSLRVKLSHGQVQQQDVPAFYRPKFDSPSRQRRRARRSAARQSQENSSVEGVVVSSVKEENEDEIKSDNNPENLTDVDKTDQINEEGSCENGDNIAGEASKYDARAIDNADPDDKVEQNVSSMDEKVEEKEVEVAGEAIKHDDRAIDNPDPEETAEQNLSSVEEKDEVVVEVSVVEENDNVKNKEINAGADILKEPDFPIVTIAAVAKMYSSVNQISNVEVSTLTNILRSKDHLCRNITRVNLGNIQTYRDHRGIYEHSIYLELDVNTANLWESGRSYIYHHIGKDTWTLNAGTTISFVRIHQIR